MSLSHNYYTVLYQWKSRLRRSFGRSVGSSILSYEIQQLHSTTSENGTIWPESSSEASEIILHSSKRSSIVRIRIRTNKRMTNERVVERVKAHAVDFMWFSHDIYQNSSVGIKDDYTEENNISKIVEYNTIQCFQLLNPKMLTIVRIIEWIMRTSL